MLGESKPSSFDYVKNGSNLVINSDPTTPALRLVQPQQADSFRDGYGFCRRCCGFHGHSWCRSF